MDSKESVVFKFKIQETITNEKPENYLKLKEGEKAVKVGLFQLASKNFFGKIFEGLETALKEGRIPFMPGN